LSKEDYTKYSKNSQNHINKYSSFDYAEKQLSNILK